MATSEAFLPFNGPFRGVSTLPGRLAQGGFSPLAVNCDTSQGILRCRPGFNVVNQHASNRILGMHSSSDFEGNATLLVAYFRPNESTNWGDIMLRRMTVNGDEETAIQLNALPYDVVPGPYEFPVFEDFMSETFVLFPKASLYRYNNMENQLKKVRPTVHEDTGIFPYFESIPTGTVMEAHGRRLFMAGFTGEDKLSVSTTIPEDQNLIPQSVVDESRGAVKLPMNAIVFSDFDDPTTWKSYNLLGAPKGFKVTGLCSVNNELLVFSEQSVSVIRGFDERGMTISTVAQGVGCVNQRTIVQASGSVCWLSHDGWYTYTGSGVQKISADIGDMFRMEGWRETPMRELGDVASELQYPLAIDRANLWQACGGFDYQRGAFFWSVPMLSPKEYFDSDTTMGGRPPRMNNMTLVFYPSTGSWDMWSPSATSSFYPTAYASVMEGTKQYMMFGNEDGQVCVWGHGTVDMVPELTDPGTGNAYSGKVTTSADSHYDSITWFWMSPRMQASGNTAVSVKSLRVRQRAVGYQEHVDKVAFYVESERSFDQVGSELSASGTLDGSPDVGPPDPKIPDHYWKQGAWGQFRWAGRDVWKGRYPVRSIITGHTIRIGFKEVLSRSKVFSEIHGYDVEVQPKRDIT